MSKPSALEILQSLKQAGIITDVKHNPLTKIGSVTLDILMAQRFATSSNAVRLYLNANSNGTSLSEDVEITLAPATSAESFVPSVDAGHPLSIASIPNGPVLLLKGQHDLVGKGMTTDKMLIQYIQDTLKSAGAVAIYDETNRSFYVSAYGGNELEEVLKELCKDNGRET